ncbi:MAG: hypothetical protein EBY37_07305 [Flavobacteriia bacterium]|jgi:hypothetical protein|nr:hypothetical protein [Flavobacteriia bacterium]
MGNLNKILFVIVLIAVLIVALSPELLAQCPMCRMSAESNLENGGTEGRGLNNGILYMLSLPYLLVATLGYIWYRNRNRFSDHIIEEPFSDN